MKENKKKTADKFEQAKDIFRKHGGVLRTSEAIESGIHPRTIYTMRDEGVIEQLNRGLFRLTDAPPLGNPDLVTIALKIPNAVICLVSALAFHNMTTQVPHDVYIAIPKGSMEPRLQYPPVKIFEFGGEAFTSGIETHELDKVPVRIYCLEKTLADCFKYRNKLGLDTAIEALRLYVERSDVNVDKLMRFARICRVAKILRPYLEAMLG